MQALASDPAAVLALLVATQAKPAGRAVASGAYVLPAATLEQWFKDPRVRNRSVRAALLEDIWRQPPPAFGQWLLQAAGRERDPALAEALWSELYLTDHDPAALTQLNRLANRDGTFRLPASINVWNWHVLQPAAAADPQGLLARGIRAYEAAEGGRPYFAVDRCPPATPCWPFVYGNVQFDPAREIPAWTAFLRAFPNHPAAADAAYRLARCEEILGNWGRALVDMHNAADVYPDGQIAYQARGRLVFMLDVEIPLTALRRLAADPPAPALAAAIRYSLGVRELRVGQYAQAAAQLRANPAPNAPLVSWIPWPTAARGARQLAQAGQMAALAARAFARPWSPAPASGGGAGAAPRTDFAPPPAIADPQAAYALAAVLFHHNLALYNNLWSGGQQFFFAFSGYITALTSGDLSPPWVRQLRAMNPYVEAEPVFAAVAADPRAPSALRADALYSEGECLVHLDGYNAATDATMQRAALRQDIVAVFRAFAARFPGAGALSRDALLTVARYTKDPADVAAVERAAPGSWQAAAARALLSPAPGTVMAGRPLGDIGFLQVPAPSGGRAEGERSRAGPGGWTTITVEPAGVPAGAGVQILRIAGTGPGAARVDWRVVPAAQQPDLIWAAAGPVAVVRVPARLTTVTFSQETG